MATSVLNATHSAYGAVGNDSTDDTAALQAWITAVATGGLVGYLPAGTYKITSKLNFPRRPNWSIRGASPGSVTIKQYANNTPIFDLGTDNVANMHTWEIRGITFTYATSQPNTSTSAICVKFSKEAYLGSVKHCTFARGYFALGGTTSPAGPWGTTFDELVFQSGMTGGAMDFEGGPGNQIGRVYVDAANMNGPLFRFGGSMDAGSIEVNQAHQSPQILVLEAGGMLNAGLLLLENCTYTSAKTLYEFQQNSTAHVGQMYVLGPTNVTINISGGPPSDVVRLLSADDVHSRVRVEEIRVDVTTLTAGRPYVAYSTSGSLITIGHVRMDNGWALQDSGNTDTGDRVLVDDWNTGRLSADKGDANVTIALGDPTVTRFTTTFTAARNVSLPATGDNLHNGLSYKLVFDGAINGANTAVIKCGATTLRTQSDDKRALTYTWRRHATVASGWILTGYETIP